MLALVSISLSKKFPLALLLGFQIFLISEIGRVASSPATVSTDGVIEVRKGVGVHQGLSLTNVHFRAGNVSRAVADSCLMDYVYCDPNDDKCCGHCAMTHPNGFMCVEGGEHCTLKDQTGCYTYARPCCENNDEAMECIDNYCRRKCTKAGSTLECQSDKECCGVGVGKINQCVPKDGTDGKKFCIACTSPDKTCDKDKHDCCNFDEDHQYSCTQSGDTSQCKKKGAECIANELPCQDTDKCCEDNNKGSECQQGKCRSCMKPGSGQTCTKDTDCCTSTLAENEGAYCKFYGSNAYAFCEICKKKGSVCDAQRDKCCDENGSIGSCSRDLTTSTYSCRNV